MISGPGVAVPLQLVTAPFDRALAGAARDLDRFSRRFAAAFRIPMQGIAAIAGGFGGGGGLSAVAKAAVDMETKMARLQRVTDLSRSKFGALGKELKDTAASMAGVSLDDVMGMASFGAKLGITGDKLGMFVRDAGQFSQALDDIDPETAATSFARLSVVFGTGIEQTKRYAAALVALDQASTASGKEILDVTQRIAPMAKLLGMSPQRAMSLATVVRETGVAVEVAGSSLTQLLGKMASPKGMVEFASLARMSATAFRDLVKADPGAALTAVAKSLSTMDAEHAIGALEKLGIEGVRARTTLLALASAGQKNAQFTEIANREWRTFAALNKNVAINSETTAAQLQRLGNNGRIVAAGFGQALLPIIKGLADGLVNLAGDIRFVLDKNKGRFEAWGQSVASYVRLVGVGFRELPTVMRLVGNVVGEKFDQLGEIINRFTSRMVDRFKWMATSIATMIKNSITGKDVMAGVGAAPDLFKDITKNLPNRGIAIGADKARLWAADKEMMAERNARGVMQKGKDAIVRFVGENGGAAAGAAPKAKMNRMQAAKARGAAIRRGKAQAAADRRLAKARARMNTPRYAKGAKRYRAAGAGAAGLFGATASRFLGRDIGGAAAGFLGGEGGKRAFGNLMGQPGGAGVVKPPAFAGDNQASLDLKEMKGHLAKMEGYMANMDRIASEV